MLGDRIHVIGIRRGLVACVTGAFLVVLPAAARAQAPGDEETGSAAPRLVASSPSSGATDVDAGRVLTAYFDAPLDAASVSTHTVSLRDDTGGRADDIPVAVFYQAGAKAIAIASIRPLTPGHGYHVEMRGVAGKGSTAAVGGIDDWHFTVGREGSTETLRERPAAVEPGRFSATVPWIDENSTIQIKYGSSRPTSVTVNVATAAGFTRSKRLDVGQDRVTSLPVATLDPGLVGQTIRSVTAVTDPAVTITEIDVMDDLGSYDAAGRKEPSPSGSRALPMSFADRILTAVRPDGSITLGPEGPYAAKVIPYFSNYAALGLLRAYDLTGVGRYRSAASSWISWYQKRMKPDGTVNDCAGAYPDCVDTGTADSTDSYTSTYLMAVRAYESTLHGKARRRHITAAAPYFEAAFGALTTDYQADGLTIALASYPVRFAMDNSETWAGLLAYADLSEMRGDTGKAKLAKYLAARTLYSIHKRFPVAPGGHYAVAVWPDGTQITSLSTWYPDALASQLVMTFTGSPSAKDRGLYHDLVDRFDVGDAANRPTALTDTSQYGWWAMAANRLGMPKYADHFITEMLSIEGSDNPATLPITSALIIEAATRGQWGMG